jgi:hypothetical protein
MGWTAMNLHDNQTYYDILDIKPDASPQEVREAYLKTKAAYNKDSVALYTLISADEREQMIRRIEEAYDVLSNPERRKQYDGNHGMLSDEQEFQTRGLSPNHRKIISIDRVPPMESSSDADDLLVAPSTDFGSATPSHAARSTSSFGTMTEEEDVSSPFAVPVPPKGAPVPTPNPASISTQNSFENTHVTPVAALANNAPSGAFGSAMIPNTEPSTDSQSTGRNQVSVSLQEEITKEVEWKGGFIRKVREAKRVSIEEMSSITKITRSYLFAIEEENFAKLPAAVYLRGFLVQVSKTLKLPHDKVATAYMARYYQARPEQVH